MKASRGAEDERLELLALVGWMPSYVGTGAKERCTTTCTPYKDTPYSDWWISAVTERRGPRHHLSLRELIKAESAAR